MTVMSSRMSTFFLIGVFLVLTVGSHGMAQRKISPKVKKRGPAPAQHLGAVSLFNHISGAMWEVQLSNRGRLSSRSTFALLGGYSSRFVHFKNDTLGRPSRDRWLHGVGGALVLNNYTRKIGEGFAWSLGVSGNLYFDEPVDLKTFSLFGMMSYRWPVGSKSSISPHLGVGLMGSIFRSTLGSDVNSIYVMGGCSWLFKM